MVCRPPPAMHIAITSLYSVVVENEGKVAIHTIDIPVEP